MHCFDVEYHGPVPPNESARLKALLATDLLYSEEERLFNRVTQTAKQILGTKTALISLVEKDKQWFKAKCGLSVAETPRSVSFCTHAILSRYPLVVLDAEEDERFRENPLVTGAPFIRLYAGAPVILKDQFAIGTLCVIDSKPRPAFGEEEIAFLDDMATLVALLIEQRMQRLDAEEQALDFPLPQAAAG